MTLVTRRQGLLVFSAAAAALVPMHGANAQQQRAGGGDWLAMVRQHHRLFARSFEELLAPNDESFERRDLQLRNVN